MNKSELRNCDQKKRGRQETALAESSRELGRQNSMQWKLSSVEGTMTMSNE
jgi:hypothetical protein